MSSLGGSYNQLEWMMDRVVNYHRYNQFRRVRENSTMQSEVFWPVVIVANLPRNDWIKAIIP